MDRSDVISLISYTWERDENGVRRKTATSKQVFANVTSVTLDELDTGGRLGLNPEYRMTVFCYDYDGQGVLEYQGKRYSIYRTYKGKNDMIELYVQREGGANG